MKAKLNLYIARPESFAKNPNHGSCYYLCSDRGMDDTWVFVQEIEIDLSQVDMARVIGDASKELDDEIGKATALINVLETRKAELLALPAPTGANENDS